MYKRILEYVKPYWIRILIASLCAIGVSGATAAVAWLVQPALDKIFIQKNLQMLMLIPVAILIMYFLKGVFNYYQSYLMRYVGNRVIMDMRNDLYSHLTVMPMQFYTEHSTGKLMSRLLNDVSIINNAASTSIKDLVQNLITVIALLGVVFYQDWRLAAISCLVLPFAYYPIIKLGRKLRRVSRKGQEEISGITAIMHETFTGASVVKAFGMEPSEINKFMEKNYSLFKISMKGVKLTELSTPLMEFIGAVGASLIIWYGGHQVVNGVTTPGTFFSFLTALIMMYSPLRALTRVNAAIQQSIAAAERVFAILDLDTEEVTNKGTTELHGIKDRIELRNVSFKYPSSTKHAISDASFSVPHGRTVALVGSSGGGKTTIGNLLLRFYEPESGGIYIDGTDIRDFTLRSLRSRIGIVSQDVILFNDTVFSNIAYGKKDIGMEDVMNAAKKAYAHDFIINMPDGYNTVIGERGAKVSGGEKQRIAIARAILKDPPILILDEATSALDTESEHMIQMALDNLMIGRTTFVIAHRLSTIKNADLIIALDNGKIVEMGRHEELLTRRGLYKRLYDMQFVEKGQL
ncbi:MAG: lipid A export permease/ATP-binding protein MsbA [Nitrospirae bacterium RBG_16_43_11]|nr:MAG: lipid A export permease/ATP-binding protein MsbA [Nitrospirae bacterium RBG_16_43_11]